MMRRCARGRSRDSHPGSWSLDENGAGIIFRSGRDVGSEWTGERFVTFGSDRDVVVGWCLDDDCAGVSSASRR
jgi:hypothetical protein